MSPFFDPLMGEFLTQSSITEELLLCPEVDSLPASRVKTGHVCFSKVFLLLSHSLCHAGSTTHTHTHFRQKHHNNSRLSSGVRL